MTQLSPKTTAQARSCQRCEATDEMIYRTIAAREKKLPNKAKLCEIADDEREHITLWEQYTGEVVAPNRAKVYWYAALGRLFGHAFTTKLLEESEIRNKHRYRALVEQFPEAHRLIAEGQAHEAVLQGMRDETSLRQASSAVLGLGDALVGLTGTMAGLTFALADGRLVGLAGMVAGVAAALATVVSNPIGRTDDDPGAFKYALYTGGAYLLIASLLVLPYLLLPAAMVGPAFAMMLALSLAVNVFLNYYIGVVQSLPFLRRFGRMVAACAGVTLTAVAVGLVAKALLGI